MPPSPSLSAPPTPSTHGVRWSARVDVARELLRAAGGGLALPWRLGMYVARREHHRQSVRDAMAQPAPQPSAPGRVELPERPLRLFVSCAEPSGEIHAASVVERLREALRERGAPEPELFGLGGERLRAQGVEILADPVADARMGISGVLGALPFYLRLLERSFAAFGQRGPDLFLPVDSPALHVPMAHAARRRGVPVVHFVTPQYWGWAPWRVAGYRRAVDRALTILPFEPAWFERHGVRSAHVGHPLLDFLPDSGGPAPGERDASRVLALLPGSRASVIRRNLPWMLRRVAELRASLPELEPRVIQGSPAQRELVEALVAAGPVPARVEVGDLHGSLARARAALSVSGTILIDLLHQRLPTVVVYRVEHGYEVWAAERVLSTPWFASVNLLAGRDVYPEFCFRGEGPSGEDGEGAIGRALLRCYNDAPWRSQCLEGMEQAARRLGPRGASERAALHALELAGARAIAGGPPRGEEDPR